MIWTNQYCRINIFQRPIHKLYSRKHEGVLGTNTTTEQCNCYHTQNCTYMFGCHHRQQGKKNQTVFAIKKKHARPYKGFLYI